MAEVFSCLLAMIDTLSGGWAFYSSLGVTPEAIDPAPAAGQSS